MVMVMQGVDRLSMRLDAATALRSLIVCLPQNKIIISFYLFIINFLFYFILFYFIFWFTRVLNYQIILLRVDK
jgi:hypothetical protein